MRVAVIRRSFRLDGGAETATNAFIEAYVLAGFNVTLICESWSGDVGKNVEICPVVSRGPRIFKLLSFEWGVQRILKRERFDFVQSHELIRGVDILRLGDGLHRVWFKRLQRLKTGKLTRFFVRISPFHLLKLKLEKDSIYDKRLKAIIVNSSMVKTEITEIYPLADEKTAVVRNAISRSFYSGASRCVIDRKSEELKLLFVGSGWRRKGLMLLFQSLRGLELSWSLTIVGHDKAINWYKKQTRILGISDQVIFSGVLKMDEAIYRQYSVTVIPSVYDPFPNVASESLVSGVPVITSKFTGVVDYRECAGVYVFENGIELVRILSAFCKSPQVPDRNFFRHEFSNLRLVEKISEMTAL